MRVATITCAAVGALLAIAVGALWADLGPAVGADQVARLIGQLGSDDFARREAASKELTGIGEPALGALRKAAASSEDPEVRRRAALAVQAVAHRASRADQKRLEGSWVGVPEEDNGRARPSRAKVVLTGGSSVARTGAGAEIFRCTWKVVDATVRPKRLDLGPQDGRVFRAIYESDGDTLRYCGSYADRPGALRPRHRMVGIWLR